jgi:hypothetical protein
MYRRMSKVSAMVTAAVFCAACGAESGSQPEEGADMSLEGTSGEGEQITDANAASGSLLPAEDRVLLSEISQRLRDLELSQEQINSVTDPLSSIEDMHEYFVALRAALDDPKTVDELAAKAGTSQSLYTPGATYPSSCNNQTVQYEIQIRTDAREYAGTDANVFIRWKGKYRSTTSNYNVPINLDTPADDWQRGSLFDRTYAQVSKGDIVQFNLYHDNTGHYTTGGPG